MPRKLPLHVVRDRSRHGRIRFYFRIGLGKRTRLPDINDPAFRAAYLQCLGGEAASPPIHHRNDKTLAALIDQYRDSARWAELSPATQKQRRNIFAHVIKEAGDFPYREISADDLKAARERRKDTPAQARNFLDAMRGLFRWAHETGLVETDPSEGVKNPRKSRSEGGFKVWSDADVEAYRARWGAETVQRRWIDVLLATGVRRGDAVRLHSDQVRDGWLEIKTEKNGMLVYVPLADHLAAIQGWFIVGETGKPLTKESFGNAFRVACLAAGIDKSAHGLRKLAATRAAEQGLSVAELEALFGWSGGTMASHYTKAANRKTLAQSGARKMHKAP
jgi:integrase